MATIDELKRRIDLFQLADKLNLKPAKATGDKSYQIYHSPHHKDSSPSLSIFVDHPKHGTGWKDHSSGKGGTCIDLVIYVQGGTPSDAMRYLHEAFAIPFDKPQEQQEPAKKSTEEYIADRCLAVKEKARDYLKGRGITDAVITAAFNAKTIGFNEYTSPTRTEGEIGYGGPAAAFIVRDPKTAGVVAVDMRFIDPALNGGIKTQTHGAKDCFGWTSNSRKLMKARRVYVFESAINCLSFECCDMPGAAAFSLRGLTNVDNIDFSFLKGKQVIICLDNDEPFQEGHQEAGRRPGPEAAWKLYERLTALNISAVIVDQHQWIYIEDFGTHKKGESINDVNDYLQARGAADLAKALDVFEPWLIAGMPGDSTAKGRRRVYLPAHDYAKYWKFRTRLDFTSYIEKMERKDDESETPILSDLCGFRIASLSRVSVASASSTMTGDPDQSPTVHFAVTVQTPRHGAQLTRKVLFDEQLHNTQQWSKFGPIWQPAQFSRMVNILERTADLGARNAANFVGLAWRDGRLAVNEGPDCYFTEPEKQCPYFNLTFPSGTAQEAKTIVKAYQTTFGSNAAAIALIWGLGGHLKALLGFWPHMTLQADKGAGKSTLVKRLERALSFTMFSGQSLQTEFRLLTSISHTSNPVGWEELSARRSEVIEKAVAMLQESYQYTVSKRGSEMTEYLLSAPVLLAGEDVPVKGLTGKVVRSSLKRQGPMLPDDLPQFPVRQWLEFLTTLDRMTVLEKYRELRKHCLEKSLSGGDDDGAKRMAGNYAAVLLAWRYVCEFTGLDYSEGNFGADLLAEMNTHIKETSQDRSPWVWIMETALSEMDAGNFKHPYKFEKINGEEALLLRPAHIIDHISTSNSLREKWNALPVKTSTVFNRQMTAAGVVIDTGAEIERTILTKRVRHLTAISLPKLAEFGLSVAWRDL